MFVKGYNLISRIEQSVAKVELQDMELLVFTDNLVSESVFYKGK